MDIDLLTKANALLHRSHKQKGIWIVVLLTLNSILDFFSLAAFLPVIVIVVNPNALLKNEVVENIYHAFGFTQHHHFVVALCITIVIFIFIKIQITGWITFRKASYAYGIADYLASSALSKYFQTTYRDFTNANFTNEMNRIANLPLSFANNIIIPAGTVFAEGVVMLFLIICISLYNFKVLLFLVLFVAPVGLLYYYKRKKIRSLSNEIKVTYPKLLKYTMQAIEGFVEIKAFNKEKFFKNRFDKTYQQLASTFARDHTVNTSASRSTEFIASILIGFLVSYAIISEKAYHETLMLLSIYAGVSFRVIPSINRILSALMTIRSKEFVVNDLHQLFDTEIKPFIFQEGTFKFEHKIELQSISVAYQDEPFRVRDVTMTIRKGERVIITGKSGSGKTTLMLLLLRFVKESHGYILVDGKKLTEAETAAWQRLIGYVPQNPYIMDASIAENIAFGVPQEQIQLKRIKELINDMDLSDWINALPEKENTIIGERGIRISGGQRQRIALARALYNNAEILLLDEITNQLDSSTEVEIMNVVSKGLASGKTILVITHRPEIWNCENMYEMSQGLLHQKNIARPKIME